MNLFCISVDTIPNVRLTGHVIYNEPWMHFTRTIDEYILYVIKSGELYIKEGEEEFVLKSGDTLLLEPKIQHTGYRKSTCDYYYIHFKHPKITTLNVNSLDEIAFNILNERKTSLASDFLSDSLPTSPVCYLPKCYHIKNLSPIIYLLKEAEFDYYNRYENYKILTSIRLIEILIKISREYISSEMEKSTSFLSKGFIKCRNIINFLNSEYHRKITSQDIETYFESNYDYLNRVFHKLTGYTIFNYLNIIRINKAKELIDTTPIKFSEVGYLVGIDDPYYFSKLFKKYVGMTPSQYSKSKC
ncbi:AraC-type DNA-binding protein [Caloramator quimbayensis]|uniref:AraC-type DNA-binding protein n=1 Tax=Caloramator quimbayensis TaxID=1147123 RepID=A0A1T4XU53_9CLOT|nr:AraC family transcriptional regulator [Caloramator quimbayensis]SKA93092.1 AraC-type DNA-binding protein [Caloramator quimbayensis]